MAYVCLECGYEAEEAGTCPDCLVDLVEESVDMGSDEKDADYDDDGGFEDEEDW